MTNSTGFPGPASRCRRYPGWVGDRGGWPGHFGTAWPAWPAHRTGLVVFNMIRDGCSHQAIGSAIGPSACAPIWLNPR